MSAISISEISLPELKLRDSYSNVKALADSIQKDGLLYPILLRNVSPAKTFEVVAGCRRFSAIKSLGRKELLPSEYIIREIDDKTAFEISLLENLQQESMTPQEQAKAFKIYCEEKGWGSASELADKIHVSLPFISQRIRLLDLPESVFRKIGVLTNFSVSHAEAISYADLSKEKIQEVVDIIKNQGISRDETRKLVKDVATHPEDSAAKSLLRVRTIEANEPFVYEAQAYQESQDSIREDLENKKRREQFEEKERQSRKIDKRLENLIILEGITHRYQNEVDTWVREFEDLDMDLNRRLIAEIRLPLHDLVGKMESIRRGFEQILKKEKAELTS